MGTCIEGGHVWQGWACRRDGQWSGRYWTVFLLIWILLWYIFSWNILQWISPLIPLLEVQRQKFSWKVVWLGLPHTQNGNKTANVLAECLCYFFTKKTKPPYPLNFWFEKKIKHTRHKLPVVRGALYEHIEIRYLTQIDFELALHVSEGDSQDLSQGCSSHVRVVGFVACHDLFVNL